MNNGIRIYVYQEENAKFGDRMHQFMFDFKTGLIIHWNSLKSVLTFKVPEYHPYIKMRFPGLMQKLFTGHSQKRADSSYTANINIFLPEIMLLYKKKCRFDEHLMFKYYYMGRFTGVIGIIIILGLAFLWSNNRKKINYRLVITGLLLQIALAIFILKVPVGQDIFYWLGKSNKQAS